MTKIVPYLCDLSSHKPKIIMRKNNRQFPIEGHPKKYLTSALHSVKVIEESPRTPEV
jgi:hypothetical protein